MFEGVRGKADAEIPAEMKLSFGRVRWGQFKTWLDKEKIEFEIVEEIEQWLKREEPFYLEDLADGAKANVPADELASKFSKLLESQTWVIKRLAYSADREKNPDLFASIDARLSGKGKLARLIFGSLKNSMKDASDLESLTECIDQWVGDVQSRLEVIWSEDSLTVTAPAFKEISSSLIDVGLQPELAGKFTDHLKYSVELPEEATEGVRMSPSELSRHYLAFSWLGWLIEDKAKREDLTRRILKALEDGHLDANTKNIASWEDMKIPVVIYTGKMSKNERRGLLEAFGKLSRAVLISTPAVEVGVDFAADTLITEQCDGNSFLQRFGRVGRRVGVKVRVIVLIKDGETYVDLYNRYKGRSEDLKMNREDFSAMIASPKDGLFPSKTHIEGSDFLDATHWLVNAQIGEIGGWLNQSMFGEGTAADLAQKIRRSGLPFAYGLRSTMPGVSLQGGAGGGDPFYILRKIYNDRLMTSDSPFGMAQADMWHMELLWKKSQWNIVVDAAATIEASQALFWLHDGRWHIQTGYGIA
ncbi:MAG: helicase-related protein, partial [Methanotrichaceae archaeon]|nr:helicase-related protein [Methanotrichaceae archaeon]